MIWFCFFNICSFDFLSQPAQSVYEHHGAESIQSEPEMIPTKSIGSVATESIVVPSTNVPSKVCGALKKRPLHMQPKQPIHQQQRFKCPRCGKDYSQRKNMRRHYRLECGQEPKYPCPVCNLRFKRHNQMSGHMLTRHGIKDTTNKVLLPDGGAFEI